MLLEIYDIEVWKNFFDLINDTTTVVELKLTEENCGMSLLNNGHVCFYTIEFGRDFFADYQVDGVESVLIFVADFYSILKSAHKDDIMTLSTDEYKLKIVLEHNENRRVFEIPMAEESSNNPIPPTIDYDDYFTVPLKELKQPCMDLDKIIKTDRFKMSTGNGELSITSPSDSMTNYLQTIIIDTNLKADSTVNLGYILDLQKLNKISNEVKFGVGNDMPVTWIMTGDDVKVKGLIAPILEETD